MLTLDKGKAAEIERVLAEKFSLTSQYASVEEVKDFPLLPSGEIDYAKLVKMSEAKVLAESADQAKLPKYSWRNLFRLNKRQENYRPWIFFRKYLLQEKSLKKAHLKYLTAIR